MTTNSDKATLLIVDDIPANLAVLFTYLREEGFNVCVAESGDDALEQIPYTKPDLILLDVMMPGIDGFETCRRLKANEDTRKIPVIFLTAMSDTVDKVKGFKIGAVDYITKPIQQEEVLARVHTHLTLKKQQEVLEEQKQELQQQNNELEAFAHTVAHDLKNPLTNVIGFSKILIRLFANIDKKSLIYLEKIAKSGYKMANIIDALLLLASARNQDVEKVQLDMGEIVAAVQQGLGTMIEEYQADIITPTNWPSALGYAPWIEEVWTNYISNGLKYGGKPPRIELGATHEENGYIRFWARDNGQGLTEQELNRLFVPFSRITSNVRIEGHGLGLSIVQRIVEKCHGKVGAESKVGEYSTFYFSLPAIN